MDDLTNRDPDSNSTLVAVPGGELCGIEVARLEGLEVEDSRRASEVEQIEVLETLGYGELEVDLTTRSATPSGVALTF